MKFKIFHREKKPSSRFMKKYCENIVTIYFAPPRTGKSTYATKIAHKCMKKNIPVYSNFYIRDTFMYNKEDLGKYDISNCKLILDEVGLEFNNREFKTFPKEALSFFKLHGHYKVSIDVFSQDWSDMDKKIRTLAQRLYIIRRSRIPFFIRAIPIYKKIGINEMTKEICDEYYTLGNFLNLFFGKWCFMPKYWKMFDSFDAPKLPPMKQVKYSKEMFSE